jgi:hypothetical protein
VYCSPWAVGVGQQGIQPQADGIGPHHNVQHGVYRDVPQHSTLQQHSGTRMSPISQVAGATVSVGSKACAWVCAGSYLSMLLRAMTVVGQQAAECTSIFEGLGVCTKVVGNMA